MDTEGNKQPMEEPVETTEEPPAPKVTSTLRLESRRKKLISQKETDKDLNVKNENNESNVYSSPSSFSASLKFFQRLVSLFLSRERRRERS